MSRREAHVSGEAIGGPPGRVTDPPDVQGRVASWATVALLAMAFLLRIAYLDYQSLRGDEALSVLYAERSVPEIIEITRFVSGHPPLFYILMHFWEEATGTTEFAARFFALWWGVLNVPLAFALGRALFGRRAASWAALLIAINPFHIMHAQDIRAYSMLAAFSLLACLAFWRALARPTLRRWVLYGLSGALVAYVHYFGAFLILAHAVFFAWDRLRRRASWRGGMLAFAAIGSSLLPWLWLARAVVTGGHGPGGRSLSLLATFQQSVITFGVGYWKQPWGDIVLSVVLTALLGWGVWMGWRRRPWETWFAALLVVIPLACIFALSLTRPIFRERYLMASAGIYALLWGNALAAFEVRGPGRLLGQLALGTSLAFMVGFGLLALAHYYWDEAYAKSPDWRGAASYVGDNLGATDAVILNHQDQAFLYYHGSLDLHVLPLASDPSPAATEGVLRGLADSHDRIWLLPDTARLWDSEGVVQDWLDRWCERVMARSWRGAEVALYHTPRYYTQEMVRLDAHLGEDIDLVGYAVRDAEGRAVSGLEVRPGGSVRLTLYWRARSAPDAEYVVFAHLLDHTGWLRGQRDNQPRQGTFSTRAWVPGELVVDTYEIPVAPDSPAGDASLELGMYHPVTADRLETSGRDADPDQGRVVLSGIVRIK